MPIFLKKLTDILALSYFHDIIRIIALISTKMLFTEKENIVIEKHFKLKF